MRDVGILQDNYRLHEPFRKSLESAFQLPSGAAPFRTVAGGGAAIDEAAVDRTAFQTWEKILNFLVVGSDARARGGSSSSSGTTAFELPSGRVQELLRVMGLVSADNEITGSGYGFVLKDVFTQVRLVLQCLIRALPAPDDAMTVLFKLSFSPRGTLLTGIPHDLLALLAELGVVVVPSATRATANAPGLVDAFCVSSIGSNAFFGTMGSVLGAHRHRLQNMEVIVETTFKLYCYTTSALHEKMLRHFVSLEAILPNLVVGCLTRQSVTAALSKGITAKQIIEFLTQNAHVTAKARPHIVPSNVADQIHIWEKDSHRVSIAQGSLLHSFATKDVYDAMVSFAQDQGILVWNEPWKDDKNGRMFIRQNGIDAIRKFSKELRAARAAVVQ